MMRDVAAMIPGLVANASGVARRVIERERRFLVASRPAGLGRGTEIVQGYLMTSPAAVRMRREDATFTLTI